MKKIYRIEVIALILAGTASLFTCANTAYSNPSGGKVVAGNAVIQQETASKVSIRQASDKAVIDWQKYGIGAGEQVQYYQPSASSVTLNRVVGQDPSQILGRLTANGQVFLVNPNGIYFGKNAQIDVAGLIATTHNIRNDDLMAGKYDFNIPGQPGAAVINEGTIRIADTGIVAFVAPSVANHGVITARLGKVALAAANGFTLDFYGDELLTFLVNDAVARTAFDQAGSPLTSFVENSGRIEAQGGYVLLTAKAAENAIHSVINQSGIIEATTVSTHKGEIILDAGKGSLQVSGTLDASAPEGGDGGFIETSGAKVTINPAAVITTVAPKGASGLWLIDPNDFYIAAAGGNVTGTSLSMYLNSGNVTIQTETMGSAGGNGDIFVNDEVSWHNGNRLILQANRNVEINNAITATSTDSMLAIQAPGVLTINGSGSVSVGNVIYNVGDANLLGTTDTYGRDSFSIRSFNNNTLHIELGHTADTLSLSPAEINRLNAINGGVLNIYGSDVFITAPFDIRSNLALHSQGDIIINAEISSAAELPAGTTSTYLGLVAAENIQFNAPVTVHYLGLINDNGQIRQNADGRIQADMFVMTGNGGNLDNATGGNSIGSVAGNVTNDFWINNGDRDMTVSDIGGYNGVTAGNIGLQTNGSLILDAPLTATGTGPVSLGGSSWTDPLCIGACKRPHIELYSDLGFINNVGAHALTVGSGEFWSLMTNNPATTTLNGIVPDAVSYNGDQVRGDILLSANRIFYISEDQPSVDPKGTQPIKYTLKTPLVEQPKYKMQVVEVDEMIVLNSGLVISEDVISRNVYSDILSGTVAEDKVAGQPRNAPLEKTKLLPAKEYQEIGYEMLDNRAHIDDTKWKSYCDSLISNKLPAYPKNSTKIILDYPVDIRIFGSSELKVDNVLNQVLLSYKINKSLDSANSIIKDLENSKQASVEYPLKEALESQNRADNAFSDEIKYGWSDAFGSQRDNLRDAIGSGYSGAKFVAELVVPENPTKEIRIIGSLATVFVSTKDFYDITTGFYSSIKKNDYVSAVNEAVKFAEKFSSVMRRSPISSANITESITNAKAIIDDAETYKTVEKSLDGQVYGKVKDMVLDSITNRQLKSAIQLFTSLSSVIGTEETKAFVEALGDAVDNFTDSAQRDRYNRMEKIYKATNAYNKAMVETRKNVGLAIQQYAQYIGYRRGTVN